MKILIAEDNENSRVLLESALESNGYEVQSAKNGKLALECITDGPPDLIISDILMPEMDGYALCQTIKVDKKLRGIPFIFYTATYTDPQNEKLAMDLGAVRFLIKPMEIDLLLKEIEAVLEIARQNAAATTVKPRKEFHELNREYSKALAKKLDDKVLALEEEKERLAVSEKKYRRLIEALRGNYFFYTRDPSGVFTYLSPSVTNVLGYMEDEYKQHFSEFVTKSNINENVFYYAEQSMQGVRQPPYEIELSNKNGGVNRLEITEEPILDANGQVVAVEGIAHDITQRIKNQREKEKLQRQLVQAQKMEAIGTLAGGIAHDFNNILSAIIGYAELSKMHLADETKLRGYIDSVVEAGKRARELVQQILTFSRQTDIVLKPVSVKHIVKEVLKLLRASLPATIEIKQDINSESLVMGDPTQIHQLLMNLCVNAGQAMGRSSGILEVTLKNVTIDEESASQVPDLIPGLYLNLTVGDTGEGMTSQVLERIFDPFFTTKEQGEGTGLGLAVVHGIVKNYGGAIRVYSELGVGTSFNVFLPVIAGGNQSKPDLDEELPRGDERILLVDDEPSLIEIGEQMLESLGYKVVSRTCSIEALELFRQRPEDFDLVITDMTMPRMTGDKLAGNIFAIRNDMPIILCTGFSYKIAENQPLDASIKGLLMKPIIRDEMARIVRKVLDAI